MNVAELTKEQIYDIVCGWIDAGELVSRSSCGKNWYEIWKSLGNGEVYNTSHARIMATSEEVRDNFQALMNAGRLMRMADVSIKHPRCISQFYVKKLVEQGVLLKIDKFPTSALYVE